MKKLFSVREKLAISSDLSSNLSDTPRTARLESTRKINLKFDMHKNTASVEKQIVFHLVSVSASQKQSFQDIEPLFDSPNFDKESLHYSHLFIDLRYQELISILNYEGELMMALAICFLISIVI